MTPQPSTLTVAPMYRAGPSIALAMPDPRCAWGIPVAGLMTWCASEGVAVCKVCAQSFCVEHMAGDVCEMCSEVQRG